MRCLYNEMRWGARLSDGRYRSAKTISRVSGYSLARTRKVLRQMETSGLVETRRGMGFSHGNRKTYRTAR